MQMSKGPDFDVYHFSDAETKSMWLYVGHAPDSFSKALQNVRRHSARVCNIPVEWSEWADKGEQHSETLVTLVTVGGLQLHIFTVALTDRDTAQMQAAASTLRVERVK
jgi:hypothetical protein